MLIAIASKIPSFTNEELDRKNLMGMITIKVIGYMGQTFVLFALTIT